MNATTQPALFISHGAPTLIIDDSATYRFLKNLGPALTKPRAIVIISAHWETHVPTVNITPSPRTIHDFGGFPAVLYTLHYPAKTDITLANHIVEVLQESGFPTAITQQRGLDHGAWIPLMGMYPDADIPVVAVSLPHNAPAEVYFDMGRALRALRNDNVLIIGSGSYTHNLYELNPYHNETSAWAKDFAAWMDSSLSEGRNQSILNWKEEAPFASKSHPSDEHFNPLLVAMGAASDGSLPRKIHDDWEMADLSMASWQFD